MKILTVILETYMINYITMRKYVQLCHRFFKFGM